MNRAFHMFAAGLLVVVVAVLGLHIRRPVSHGDPQAQLIALMGRSGFGHMGSHRMGTGETILSFVHAACAVPVEILYLPAIYHVSEYAFAYVANAGGNATFIHDAEAVGGLEASVLLPRWAWRRFLVALGITPSRRWQSIALAVLDRGDCIREPMNWKWLTSDEAR